MVGIEEQNVIWKPQPRQAEFLSRSEDEVLYGGSAGGGKSDALLSDGTRQAHIKHYRGIIFRRTYPQLTDLIDRSKQIYPLAFPGAVFNESKKVWIFPSGAKLYFGNMQREADKYNYQGKSYDFIGFDELTHFTQSQYEYLKSRNRPNGPGTRCYVRASANPGGVGHAWVKERFITPAPPGTTLWERVEIINPKTKKKEVRWKSRCFINSSVWDNQALLENDPNYVSTLAMLPEAERKALLYGDWDSFSGQVFSEFKNDSEHYQDRTWTHVIAPFKIPDNWLIYRGFDWGYSKPFSVHWYAVDTDGRIYCIREYYGCTGEPNVGVKMQPVEVARHIREIEEQDLNLKGKDIIGIADPAIFAQSTGAESIATLMEKEFIAFNKGKNDRITGKMQLHYRFAFDENGIPMFYVFNTCKHFIRTIPNLVYDEKDVEDINTDMEDHIYDDCRYVCMENPISPEKIITPKIILDDPLNMHQINKQYGNYNFYMS